MTSGPLGDVILSGALHRRVRGGAKNLISRRFERDASSRGLGTQHAKAARLRFHVMKELPTPFPVDALQEEQVKPLELPT